MSNIAAGSDKATRHDEEAYRRLCVWGQFYEAGTDKLPPLSPYTQPQTTTKSFA